MSDPASAVERALSRLGGLHPKRLDTVNSSTLSLHRIERLLTALGNPQDKLAPVLHVAGTNGKGSTVATLRACLEAAGYRVHVFTSPHLVRFNERIRVAGDVIGDAALAALLDEVERVNSGAEITFFEILTCVAFLAFSRTPADFVLLEVGLGGRLDTTNVVAHPAVAAITPVSLDHQAFLGPTVAAIAGEKAGILKPGAPAVVAHQAAEALEVIEAEAQRVGAPLVLAGRDFDAWAQAGRLAFQDEGGLLDLPSPALFGAHQFDNAGLAVAAALTFDHSLGEDALGRGVSSAVWPARFQRLTKGPLAELAKARGSDLWLDGGHNPHAGRALAEAASRLVDRDPRPLVLVVGMFARKDAEGYFRPFAEMHPRVFTTTFDSENAATPGDLAEAARLAGLSAEPVADVTEGLRKALDGQGPAPHVLICGGLHFAGEVLAMSEETWPR